MADKRGESEHDRFKELLGKLVKVPKDEVKREKRKQRAKKKARKS